MVHHLRSWRSLLRARRAALVQEAACREPWKAAFCAIALARLDPARPRSAQRGDARAASSVTSRRGRGAGPAFRSSASRVARSAAPILGTIRVRRGFLRGVTEGSAPSAASWRPAVPPGAAREDLSRAHFAHHRRPACSPRRRRGVAGFRRPARARCRRRAGRHDLDGPDGSDGAPHDAATHGAPDDASPDGASHDAPRDASPDDASGDDAPHVIATGPAGDATVRIPAAQGQRQRAGRRGGVSGIELSGARSVSSHPSGTARLPSTCNGRTGATRSSGLAPCFKEN